VPEQLDNVSEVGRILIAEIDAREAADQRVLGTTTIGCDMVGCKGRRFTQLMDSGEIPSVLEGRSRRPFMSGIYNLLRRRIAKSHPADKPPVKAHDGRALRKREVTKSESKGDGLCRSQSSALGKPGAENPPQAG
jgi:hypothetical protein